MTTIRCTYPPPKGPCGLCVYCKTFEHGPLWWLKVPKTDKRKVRK